MINGDFELFYQANGFVHVTIGEDDERRFAAQFQRRLFQIGVSARSHDDFTRFGAAREAQFSHYGMIRQSLTNDAT